MEIRQLTRDDLPLRVEWMNHPAVYSSMHFQLPVLLENTERWYEHIMFDSSRTDVACVEDGLVVAMGGLTHWDMENSKAELYVFVNPYLQKSGFGTKAVRLLCQYGFNELYLEKIYLMTNEDNIPAQRVYEKCGFTLEGNLRQEYHVSDGIYKSRFYYGLLKNEWNG